MKEQTNNEEIVTVALYELGGLIDGVHTEEIAVKAFSLAPNRFRWELEKFKNNINLSYVYSALSDARKIGFVEGTPKKGWVLTKSGLDLAKKITGKTSDRAKPSAEEKKLKNWKSVQQKRICNDPAYAKFEEGLLQEINKRELMGFFQISDYLKPYNRSRLIEQYKKVFQDNDSVSNAVTALAKLYEEKYA